jgi:hypothetical protein
MAGQRASRRFADGDGREGLGSAGCFRSAKATCDFSCRYTALHSTSHKGHTETAMALVAAGADVHCHDKDGCGEGRCIAGQLASGRLPEGLGFADCSRGMGRVLGCAGLQHCTWRRRTGTRRRRRLWWWWRARTCAARTTTGTVHRGAVCECVCLAACARHTASQGFALQIACAALGVCLAAQVYRAALGIT